MRYGFALLTFCVAACGEGRAPAVPPPKSLETPAASDNDRGANDRPAASSTPPALLARPSTPPSPSLHDELTFFIEQEVAMGFVDRDRIIEDAIEVVGATEALRPIVRELTDRTLEAHRQREASWREPTDCDRLDHAFATLDEQGIVARQRWSDCNTCGTSEIHTEMNDLAAAGRIVRGYVFYHEQDLENATSGTMFLAYGSTADDSSRAAAIGHDIVGTLNRFGLRTRWNGNVNDRIELVDLDWKRRRFTESPPVSRR